MLLHILFNSPCNILLFLCVCVFFFSPLWFENEFALKLFDISNF